MCMTVGAHGVPGYCRICYMHSGRDIKTPNYSINGEENAAVFQELVGGRKMAVQMRTEL